MKKSTRFVNYKAALATLGEGISGEKKFTSALGEAFTYAFTGQDIDAAGEADQAEPSGDTADDSGDTSDETGAMTKGEVGADGETEDAVSESTETSAQSFADAVIAAFMQDQSTYSDYSIPAGVTYGMPVILFDYTTPLSGVVSSPFGYRVHPTEGVVRYHYGVDIAAETGTKIAAFADGKSLIPASPIRLGTTSCSAMAPLRRCTHIAARYLL